MKKVKASDYAKFITLYYDYYMDQIKKTGSALAINHKVYKNVFLLKYDTIIQIKREFEKNNIEKDISLVEMFKIIFWRKSLNLPYGM